MISIVRRALGAATLTCAATLATASVVSAQPTFDLELLDRGKPVPNAQVLFLVDQGKIPLGATGADGVLQVDMDLVDVGKGQEVIAFEIECDGEIVIVFVLADEVERFEEECDLRKRENPECECRRLGAFVWGDGPVRIDIGDRVVRQRPPGGMGGIAGLVIGGGFDLRQMFHLDDVAGMADGATGSDATSFAPGFQVLAEYPLGRYVTLGVEAGWSPMETETRFGDRIQTGNLDYWEIGATGRFGPWIGQRFRAYALFGLFRAWNKAEFSFDAARESRDHVTRRDGLGAGFDYWAGDRLGLRFEGMYSSTFEDDDADEHLRWKLGLLYRPFVSLAY